MGTFVAIVLELAAVAIAAWRGKIHPGPRPPKLAFAALGLVSVILLGWQGWRVSRAHHETELQAQNDAQAIRKAQDDADQARIEAEQYEQRVLHLGGKAQPESARSSDPGAGAQTGNPQAGNPTNPSGVPGAAANPSGAARVLTSDQRIELRKLLKKIGPHGIVVRYAKDNDEAQRYADAFASVLRDAGWTFRQPKFILWKQEPRGLVIMVPDLTDVPREADDFALSLSKVDIQVKWLEESSLDAGTFELMVGAP